MCTASFRKRTEIPLPFYFRWKKHICFSESAEKMALLFTDFFSCSLKGTTDYLVISVMNRDFRYTSEELW